MENVELEHTEIDSYLPTIFRKLEWLDKEEVIKRFVALEFNRFLEYYKDDKDINVNEERGRESASGKTGKNRRDDAGGRNDRKEVTDFTRLSINVGKNQGLWPNTLIDLINSASPGKRIRIGDISLGKDESVFEVDTAYASFLRDTLNECEYNGEDIVVGTASGQDRVKVEGQRAFGKKGNFKEKRAYSGGQDHRERSEFRGKKEKKSAWEPASANGPGRGKEYKGKKETAGTSKFPGSKEKPAKSSSDGSRKPWEEMMSGGREDRFSKEKKGKAKSRKNRG
jgi:ATP-dependent RNA helicase DeaD